MTSFVSLLTPLMLASRLWNARSTDAYDPHAEFGLPALSIERWNW